jgi:peroxiredoxin Q/BCP
MPRVGDKAPEFELENQDGEKVRLADFKGRNVVLYFYPKADTPGCTIQACGVRDRRADYETAGAVVFGISPDPVKKVKRFDDKYELGFPLLADADHAVAEAYGTWVEKKLYGRTYMGVARTTFVIDAEGRIAAVLENVKPKTHDDDVLAALSSAG